jgi:hypothetical protein
MARNENAALESLMLWPPTRDNPGLSRVAELFCLLSPAQRSSRAALAIGPDNGYIGAMDNPLPCDDAPRPETDADRKRRIAREAAMIAEARAELDSGLYVDADEVDAWLGSIGTDHELPPPPTRHR